ncbi:response regulator transcription factor [Herminiimonas glaciei]|uniref:Response regulator transcription factor n=1 Tax=Herminiimonas glaciei TaxID=523788 RepID=A0ABW2I9D3_9BURK
MKIATLELDQHESNILQRMVVDAGHECTAFFTGLSLIDALHYKKFDLLILEWLLPDMAGSELIRLIRSSASKNMMVMFLTHRSSDAEVVQGIRAGANDYVTKPVSAAELAVRIHTLSKITPPSVYESNKAIKRMPDLLGVGFYCFDLIQRVATIRGCAVALQTKEFDIAVLLFTHAGQVISREQIMNEVWGRASVTSARTLDTHMSRVRSKLQLNPDNNIRLVTIYTIGYRLDVL